MSRLEAYQLSHPGLLSEQALSEILKNSCIKLPALENLDKDKLIELFKRIALPLPQRRYNESTNLGKKMIKLRAKKGINVAVYTETSNILSESTLVVDTKMKADSTTDSLKKNRLKPPVTETCSISKKIRLSSSCQFDSNEAETDIKRKNNVSCLPDSKKRQKITWP